MFLLSAAQSGIDVKNLSFEKGRQSTKIGHLRNHENEKEALHKLILDILCSPAVASSQSGS